MVYNRKIYSPVKGCGRWEKLAHIPNESKVGKSYCISKYIKIGKNLYPQVQQ